MANSVAVILILIVSLAVVFSLSPLYRCPFEGGWYILGNHATLIRQMDDSFTLCHYSFGEEHNTACHNFTGGFHGLFANIK